MAPATATKTAGPADSAELDAAQIAAGFRAIRTALATFAGAFGYRADTQNATLVRLGADLDDVEALRQFILRYPPASQDSETT
jgi:hypothetical protein